MGRLDQPLTGIGLKLASVGVFLIMISLLKASPGFPPGEMVFFRSLFAIPPIFVFLAMRGQIGLGMRTTRPLGHLMRGLVGACSMGLSFFALTQLALPETVAIGYATPLLIVVLSAVVLKEQVRLYRWSAVMVGLVGVAIIMLPRLSVFSGGADALSGATLGAAAAFLAAFFAANASLMVRQLVETERSATIVFYFSVTSSVLALLTLPFGWVWPTPEQAAVLIGAGIAGGIAQIFLTECYRYADMSVIAPFEYASLVLSIVIGYWIFAEVPTADMLLGSLIVMAAGIFIILREHQLGLERARARRVMTPQG